MKKEARKSTDVDVSENEREQSSVDLRSKARVAAMLVISSVMFAIALNVFLLPSEIVSGGFSAIAIILNILFDFPVGLAVILLNIPFLTANALIYGKGYVKRAFVGVMLTGTTSELLSHLGAMTQNRIVNASFGGALIGAAMGFIFSLGYTTGGTDLAATLIRLKYKNLKLGTAIFLCDFAIIAAALAVTGDVYGVVLALISILIQTVVINFIMKSEPAPH